MLNLPGDSLPIGCSLQNLAKKKPWFTCMLYTYIYYCKLTKLCIVMNIFQYGIWYHAFLMRFLAKGRGWWILCLLFYTEKKAAIFVSLLSKTHNLTSSSSSSSWRSIIIQSFSDTLNSHRTELFPCESKKRDLRGFQKLLIKTACLLVE